MRVLFLVNRFQQGWGGAPESVRLMAHRLAGPGLGFDVADRGRLHRGVEELDVLPLPDAPAPAFDPARAPDYAAVCLVGPWQPFPATRAVVKRMRAGQPLYYLPRGGLAAIEFAGRRNLKKRPYWALLERRFAARADAVIYSSQAEQRESSRARRAGRAAEVIPDIFAPLAGQRPPGAPDARDGGALVIGFLAEIDPRKGLLPLVRAFVAFSRSGRAGRPVRLVVAGAPRPGREAYLDACRAAAAGADVRFVGKIDHEDRRRFYAGVDVFAAPSLFESYCLTALEALSEGCTLAAAPNLGVLEFLPPGAAVVARSAGEGDLEAVLDQACTAFRPDRDGRRSAALAAINSINAEAARRWARLLPGTAHG